MHFVFDLDGTISDSYPGIDRAFRTALRRIDHPEVNRTHYREFIGTPLQVSFSQLLNIPVENTRDVVDYYREYYSGNGWKENQLYEGMAGLISGLHKDNVLVSVVTNKPTVFAEKILDHFELRHYFHKVSGQELSYTPVQKSTLLSRLIDQVPGKRTFYIGDTRHDIESARACAIPSIAVGYGYGTPSGLQEMQPEYYVQTVEELANCISTIRQC